MREIKYQAYVVKQYLSGANGIGSPGIDEWEEMVEVTGISFADGKVDYITDQEGDEYSFVENSLKAVRVYTGLKDKNGVEIYEGDVLSKHGHPSRKIIFENGCFVGVSTNVVQALNWKPGKLKSLIELHFKVVGNIYENPELLEESK